MSIVYLGKATPASGQGGGSGGDAVWGSITGTLSDQTDLAAALAEKQNVSPHCHSEEPESKRIPPLSF